MSETRIFAIWQSIIRRETIAEAKKKMYKDLEDKGLYLRPSNNLYSKDLPYHQITIDEYLKEVANG